MTFNPATGAYIIRVPRTDYEFGKNLRDEHGFDFSTSASTQGEGVFFTREPYAAAAFWECADEQARSTLIAYQAEIEASWRSQSAAHIRCPSDQELWPFQKAGVEYALRRNHCLFGDEPGLGKTPQAICLANEIGAKRVLVICPASIRLQWAKMIRRWSTMPWPYVVYPIMHGKAGVHPDANWTIVSYDLSRSEQIARAILKGKYDLLIIDEGHYLKTVDSLRTQAIFGGGRDRKFDPIVNAVGYIAVATGTPLPNRPKEAFTISKALCHEAIDFSGETAFISKYNPSQVMTGTRKDGTTYTYTDERSGRHGELQSRMRVNFMVRRLKRDVMPQLDMPEFDLVYAEESKAVREALKAESLLKIDPENLEGANMAVLGQIATVRRMMGEALAPFTAEFCKVALDGGDQKIFVAYHHKAVGDQIEQRLSKYGVVRVDGSVSGMVKPTLVAEFVENPNKRVFLGSTTSVGVGTDGLQEVCDHIILAEPDWVYGTNQQVVDRLNRGGQNNTVRADFIVARNSFSEKVLAKAIGKGHTVFKALDRRILSA